MDPNNNLRDLRTNVQTALGMVYSDTRPRPKKMVLLDLLTEIAEDFDNLDDWLSKGGFAPGAWQANNDARIDAGAKAIWEAFPYLCDDYSIDWFRKVAATVLGAVK